MSIMRVVIFGACIYSSSLFAMEKEKIEAQDAPRASVSGASQEGTTKDKSILDYLTIPALGKTASLAIWGSGAAAALGGILALGVRIIRQKKFAYDMRSIPADTVWQRNLLEFFAQASSHIPSFRDMWPDHGPSLQNNPHYLLAHDAITDAFTQEEKNAFLTLLQEYTTTYFHQKLAEILESSDPASDITPEEYLSKIMPEKNRLGLGWQDIENLYAEIDSLREMQAAYCENYGLTNPFKKIDPTDWVGRMEHLLKEFHQKFPDEVLHFDAQNIFLLFARESFIAKLEEAQKRECAAIYDVWINEFTQKRLVSITSDKANLIELAQTLLAQDYGEWSKHPKWGLFEADQQSELKILQQTINHHKNDKDRLFPVLTSSAIEQ